MSNNILATRQNSLGTEHKHNLRYCTVCNTCPCPPCIRTHMYIYTFAFVCENGCASLSGASHFQYSNLWCANHLLCLPVARVFYTIAASVELDFLSFLCFSSLLFCVCIVFGFLVLRSIQLFAIISISIGIK